ncbi:MAG: hypothetical protein JST48_10050 [Bacteroidetes bacterium]|nr:hypothetical protein [Bacteroidota bacterium]
MASEHILKFAIGLIGLSVTVLILVWGLIKKDSQKIKRAAVIFIITWIILLLVGLLEFFETI